MALKKVVVYFEDQRDALRFALAAGSVLAEEAHCTPRETTPLTQTLRRAARIRSGGTITLEDEPELPSQNWDGN
ncbi:MAG TPA: hypothetical protein VEG30_01665 [Terriglobales bacterium]|nr:hypothetical protein [Terriglobales bacterium]